jgi:hypothetical protein
LSQPGHRLPRFFAFTGKNGSWGRGLLGLVRFRSLLLGLFGSLFARGGLSLLRFTLNLFLLGGVRLLLFVRRRRLLLFRSRAFRLLGIDINSEKRLSDGNGVSNSSVELGEDTFRRSLDLNSNFISLDVSDGLILINPFALLLDELGDSALSDGISDIRHREDLF